MTQPVATYYNASHITYSQAIVTYSGAVAAAKGDLPEYLKAHWTGSATSLRVNVNWRGGR